MSEHRGKEVNYVEKPYNDAIYAGLVYINYNKDSGVRHGFGVMKYRNGR